MRKLTRRRFFFHRYFSFLDPSNYVVIIFIYFLRSFTVNIYVGNIPRSTDEQTIRNLFEEYGEVAEVKLLKDNYTGELRGFGFITMHAQEEAEKAIEGLNSTELDGRTLVVNKARPRGERSGGNRYGNNGGGFRNSRSW